MSDYWDVVHFKKTKSDKTFAVKLGSAKQQQNGGWALYLDAMPAAVDGQYLLNITPPREQGQRQSAAAPARTSARSFDDPMSDEIPF